MIDRVIAKALDAAAAMAEEGGLLRLSISPEVSTEAAREVVIKVPAGLDAEALANAVEAQVRAAVGA